MTTKGSSKNSRMLIAAGVLLIASGVLFNVWTITTFFNHIGLLTPELRAIIWAFDILSVLGGLLMIRYNSHIRGREIMFTLVIFIVFLLLMEGGVRLFYFVKYKISPRERNFSEYLGWDVSPNFHSEKYLKGYGKVSYSTVQYGFRVFGDVHTAKTKIFVIGDSVTQAYTVSDGNAYYDYINKNSADVEVFAYGCGGYSTIQEYMILDKYVDMIKPDIILWQFSDNDIINNDHELESASYRNNNHMTRPYFEHGKITWLYPKQGSGWLSNIVRSSYLLRFLSIRMRIFAAEKDGSIEDGLSNAHPLFIRAATTTSDLMGLVRKKAGTTPVVAFFAGGEEWARNAFQQISKKHSLRYLPDIPDIITQAKKTGFVVDGSPYDGHWNTLGHSLVGKRILDYLIRSDLIHGKNRTQNEGV